MFKEVETSKTHYYKNGSPRTGRRTRWVQKIADLIVLLAENRWVTQREIAERFGICRKSAYRNVRALELSGLPIEYRYDPDTGGGGGPGRYQAVRLPIDWVARRRWLKEAPLVNR